MKEFTIQSKSPLAFTHVPPACWPRRPRPARAPSPLLTRNGKSVDATRLMALMGMGIKCGDTVTVKIEGADEDTAAPALEKFFNEHL